MLDPISPEARLTIVNAVAQGKRLDVAAHDAGVSFARVRANMRSDPAFTAAIKAAVNGSKVVRVTGVTVWHKRIAAVVMERSKDRDWSVAHATLDTTTGRIEDHGHGEPISGCTPYGFVHHVVVDLHAQKVVVDANNTKDPELIEEIRQLTEKLGATFEVLTIPDNELDKAHEVWEGWGDEQGWTIQQMCAAATGWLGFAPSPA